MQFQTMPITAKGVGENDVGARIDELLMEQRDALWVVGNPKLGRLARCETHLEIVCSGSTICQEHRRCCKQLLQRCLHA
jgi:hypothetical protein